MTSHQPVFVPRGLVFPQPVISEGMEMYSFMLRGTRQRLQALCDLYLNTPANGAVQYRPLSEMVMVTVTATQKIRSGDPAYINLGYLPQRETAVWVLVENAKQVGVEGRVSFFMPFLYVDHSIAMAAGREIFGFAKEYGICRMPEDPGTNGKLGIDVWAIEKFQPDAFPQQKPLFDFAPTESSILQKVEQAIKNTEDALSSFIQDLGTPGALDSEVSMILSAFMTIAHMEKPQFQIVLLKQFRDIVDGRLACYQAILETPAVATKIDGLRLLTNYVATVYQYDSHPLVDMLGLQLENGTAKTVMAFYFAGDTTIENGTVVWEA